MMHLPTADIKAAQLRAKTNQKIRNFFAWRNVLEVQTPVLSQAGVTDPHLASVSASMSLTGKIQKGYLHTSPESAMKRLLAAWQEPIYQICPVFRDAEQGSRHNIEFSMLEWYRPNFSLDDLANELNELLSSIFGYDLVFNHISYTQAFLDYADVDPFCVTIAELEQVAVLNSIQTTLLGQSKSVSMLADQEGNTFDYSVSEVLDSSEDTQALKHAWLDLLYSHLVEPNLGQDIPTLICDFPAHQASLAKVSSDNMGRMVAKRFELYINGLEIANAYEELRNANELRARFDKDNIQRQKMGLPVMPIDENLLSALDDMPECSGIALGLDRLLMVLGNYKSINQVIHFPSQIA